MPAPRLVRTAVPTRGSGRDSAFGRLRRFYYRNERRLIVFWIALLLCLNSLPIVWQTLDQHLQIESRIIEERETRWAVPLRDAAKLARKGKNAEAIALYEQTLAKMPPLGVPDRSGRARLEATTALSKLQLSMGRAKYARNLAAEVVAADPLDYRAHTALGNALLELDKTERAVVQYERSLEMHPFQLPVVKQLMTMDLERTRHEDVIKRIDNYLTSTFVSKGAIYFSNRYDELETSKDVLRFPVILDAKPHTYRVYVNSNRTPGATEFASRQSIEGLRLVPALVDHVVARINSLKIHYEHQDRDSSPTVFNSDTLDTWRRLGHLDVLGAGLVHSPRSLASLAGRVSLDAPDRVTFIEIRMTLQRSIDSEFLDMMQVAYRNTLRGDQGMELAAQLIAYDDLERMPRLEPNSEFATARVGSHR